MTATRPALVPKVEVIGGKELRAALKKAKGTLNDLKEIGTAAAQPVVDAARDKVPVLTGALEASIRAAGQASGAVVRAGGAATKYAAVQHFGWPAHNIEPTPFLYEALDERRTEVLEIFSERVGDVIDEV